MTASDFVYLASQSPRRAQLLEQLGIRYQLLLADDTEDAEALEIALERESPSAYVKRVTALKLGAAVERLKRRHLPIAPVLCADTTVATGQLIFGKPRDAQDAFGMLSQLSGRTHRVLTTVAIHAVTEGSVPCSLTSVSRVGFAVMSAAQMNAYIATGEPFGKAGAYAIQGRAAMHITRISGSYSGIMGLPLHETAQLLRAVGLLD